MSCDCPNCKRDNILNGTLTENCSSCSIKLDVKSKFQIMADKSFVCDECVSKYYILCPSCRKLDKKDKMVNVGSVSNIDETTTEVKVCEKCFSQNYRECSECHKHFDRHSIMSHKDTILCKPCFSQYYQICSQCNTIHPKGKLTHFIYEKIACDSCYGYFGPIERYEKKPKLEFQGKPPHYYGIELEVELVNQKREERGLKALEVVNFLDKDFVIVKEDGSLHCGFEICTQPATLEEHRIRWNKFFNKIDENSGAFNLHSFNTSNCGLHIHCSKKPLSLLTIAKIVVFINDDKNQSFVETIAGRRSCSYSCIQKKEYGTVKRIGILGRGDRYEAVNLVNKDTIEFRIFKGTLKRESFFKAIEFCDAMIHFCITGAYGIRYCRNKENFINFVTSRQKDYPHLYAFICAKILKQKNKLTKAFGYTIVGEEVAASSNNEPIVNQEQNTEGIVNNTDNTH